MSNQNLYTLLDEHPYPGRGILMGCLPGETKAFMAYFIMGRSANSRNRVFTTTEDGIVTEAADPAKMEDPSLIIYAPVRKLDRRVIVTNGDQTDTVLECLRGGLSFESALRTREFEPDAPNYTPRISGLLTLDWEGFTYQLSILKTGDGNPACGQRFFFDYPCPMPGTGHFIHTYAKAQPGDTALRSFAGEPTAVALESDDIDELAQGIWQHMNEDNRVSLFVRTLALSGEEDTRIINRYEKTPAFSAFSAF